MTAEAEAVDGFDPDWGALLRRLHDLCGCRPRPHVMPARVTMGRGDDLARPAAWEDIDTIGAHANPFLDRVRSRTVDGVSVTYAPDRGRR